MAFKGFGKNSGPTEPPRAQTLFGNFPRTPSPPLASFEEFQAAESLRSLPLAFDRNHAITVPSHPSAGVRNSESRPNWTYGQKSVYKDLDAPTDEGSSPHLPPITSNNSGIGVSHTASQVQDLKRIRSPPSLPVDERILRNSRMTRGSHSELIFNDPGHLTAQQMQSPPSTFQNNLGYLVTQRPQSPPLGFRNSPPIGNQTPPFGEVQRPSLSSPLKGNQSQSPRNFAIPLAQQKIPTISTYLDTYDSAKNMPTKPTDQVSKRSRSPPILPSNGDSFQNSVYGVHNSKRPSSSPPKLRQNFPSSAPGSQTHQQSLTSGHHNSADIGLMKPMNLPVAKRTKLPFVRTSDHVLEDESSTVQDDSERESLAKAKRLARFKNDLHQPVQSDPGPQDQKVVAKRQHELVVERQKIIGESSASTTGDFSNGNMISDYEGPESSGIIIGSCLDMCPESERAERERKGDLDRYERLDGERNQTSKSLAVKKYTRTAERDAELIRPMPILQQTMDYLLNLLNQPYDDKFLGLYNFLWDRMRAVRMDLRMQHIFNLEAITMLEQMIRLHIIAVHELCEYTKGEGFSEGFDAHLNIEQMNKTSVELFQLYDDHRKKGIYVPTEREFRGYYALLKLDKHPGYKVEPAELSLDLAKMTPDMRQTPEIVFARDVARACRTGNFIAFFRLARKASYLQACLMHAHFAKLRTQALASLHCGLQNNQGIPVSQVAKWLGMEEEDIESLLVYHGLTIKEFKEPYMVKEGSFLNVDNDYLVRCSRLVYGKKSRAIVEDVFCTHLAETISSIKVIEPQLDKVEENPASVQFLESDSFNQAIDEDMPDYETMSSPKDKVKIMPVFKMPIHKKGQDESVVIPTSPKVSAAHGPPESPKDIFRSSGKLKYATVFGSSLDKVEQIEATETPFQLTASRVEQERLPVGQTDFVEKSSVPQHLPVEVMEDEEQLISCQQAETDVAEAGYYDEEVAEAKLKLIIRIWRRHSSKKRELREQKKLAAKAALSSLSLGPPIWHYKTQPNLLGDFNIDGVMMKRYEIQQKSWSRLNVSDAVVSKLSGKNNAANCLCWKVILCCHDDMQYLNKPSQRNEVDKLAAGSWLLSKLIPANDGIDDELVLSSPRLSIWKKCIPNVYGGELTSCFSVIKKTEFDNLSETVAGASAIVFLVSEFFPWEIQKKRLCELLMALPSGSCLPLLILSSSCKNFLDPSTITEKLGLHDIDKSQVNVFCIVFLKDDPTEQLSGFFSDEQLRQGLEWLADESPPQPVLHHVKTRELVLYHLNPLLQAHDKINAQNTNPNALISAFNEALDQSAREVAAAAQATPTCWPCPEIALLEQCGSQNSYFLQYLPSIGWSSAARIEPLVHAIAGCKLPAFEEDISWLYKGSDKNSEIEYQMSQLENCLFKYFTETSKLMGRSIAAKEVNIMLQKYTRLQLHNCNFYLMPNWVMVFRRAFNWQLMNLAHGRFSSVYVLKQPELSVSPQAVSVSVSNLNIEDGSVLPFVLVQPSLDEMVEVGCTPFASESDILNTQGCFETRWPMALDDHNIEKAVEPLGDEMNVDQDGTFATSYNHATTQVNNKGGESLPATKASKGANKLSELLEKCNLVQNMIDKKLSIYF
nr:SAC3 family protein B-like isoform X1 [Ipomoea batatas]